MVEFEPALPWGSSFTGGVIRFRDGITADDLLNGRVYFLVMQQDDSSTYAYTPFDDNDYYVFDTFKITAFEGTVNEINVVQAAGNNILVGVGFTDNGIAPGLPWSSDVGRAIILNPTLLTDTDLLNGALDLVGSDGVHDEEHAVYAIGDGQVIATFPLYGARYKLYCEVYSEDFGVISVEKDRGTNGFYITEVSLNSPSAEG